MTQMFATPLVIAAHGYGDTAFDALEDYGAATEAFGDHGWLIAAADFHGEVNNAEFDPYPVGGSHFTTGVRTMGSPASQWDVIDIVNYMQANYNVDPSRIYLVGHSMGGMTALLAGARWTDRFAAVVADSSPTDLGDWFSEDRYRWHHAQ